MHDYLKQSEAHVCEDIIMSYMYCSDMKMRNGSIASDDAGFQINANIKRS